jgi:hypothetical protein
VRGFGDSIPAFMLIAIPKPRRDRAAESEAEALAPLAPVAEMVAAPMSEPMPEPIPGIAPHDVMEQAPADAG